jgi:hypothetical protein
VVFSHRIRAGYIRINFVDFVFNERINYIERGSEKEKEKRTAARERINTQLERYNNNNNNNNNKSTGMYIINKYKVLVQTCFYYILNN